MENEKWMICNKVGDFAAISERFGVGEPVARLLVNRGLTEPLQIEQYLWPTLESLTDARRLPDAELLCGYLEESLRLHRRIRIFGDYDVDGVCGTYLLMTGLLRLGANVDFRIPHRRKDGYGISDRMVEEAIADRIDLLLTVDSGIAALPQVAAARNAGITVLITDHHEPGGTLPDAHAVCDPKRADSDYPGEICGAVVAAKLMELLYSRLSVGSFLPAHLDVMALATVCDVMKLTGENRTIVKLGLKQLREREHLGLAKLAETCGIEASRISAYHLGFVLGPCINAAGRLEDAKNGVELLLAEREDDAAAYAKQLFSYNELRKQRTSEMVERALEMLAELPELPDYMLLFYLPECDESLAGIVAGKVREACYRPVVVLTDSEEPDMLKGSARSIEGVSVFHILQQCGDLLQKYGGHEQAAGMSLPRGRLEEFAKRLERVGQIPPELRLRKRLIDIVLPFSYLNRELLTETSLLEPFGAGNPQPLYAKRACELCRIALAGKTNRFLKLYFQEAGRTYEGVYFDGAEAFLQELEERYGAETVRALWQKRTSIRLHLLYTPRLSRYGEHENVEIVVKGYQHVL